MAAVETAPERQSNSHPLRKRRGLLKAGATVGLAGLASQIPEIDNLFRRSTQTSKPAAPAQAEKPLAMASVNAEMTTFTGYKDNLQLPPTEAFAAMDGFASVVLPDGRQLIVCGDTWKGQLAKTVGKTSLAKESYMVNNTAVIVKKDTNEVTMTVLSGPKDLGNRDTSWISPLDDMEEAQIYQEQKGSSYYWPQTPIVDHVNKKLFIPLIRNVPSLKPDQWWIHVGIDMARFDVSGKFPQLETITAIDRPYETNTETVWGAAIATDANNEFAYVYGSRKKETGKELHVARVPLKNLDDPKQWTFWNGKEWKNEKTQSAAVINEKKGISSAFSVHFLNGKYVLTNMEEQPYFSGKRIQAFVSDTPQGPWTERTLVNQIPNLQTGQHAPESGVTAAYSAYLHPEVKSPDHPGKSLVTLCRNVFKAKETDKPFDAVKADIETYRPMSLWVDLK
jgi:hypothetical protein